jgi:glucosyl-dolichyl phosphate glucuronosyltransferase
VTGPSAVPTLEVVICTYNNHVMLDGVLLALGAQKSVEAARWNCLVVDNNCTDDTPSVIQRHILTGQIPGLRSVRETEQGLTPARLRGVRSSTAQWIAFVDDDCFLRPDWTAHAIAFAQSHPWVGAFGGKVLLHWEVEPPGLVRKYGYCFAEQNRGDTECQVPFLAGAGLVVSRSAIFATGWTDDPLVADRVGNSLVSGGDVEIVLRIAGAGRELWYVPGCELQHQIPARRTSVRYLMSINRNLGISQSLADALVFADSIPKWILQSTARAAKEILNFAKLALSLARGSRSRAEALIDANFSFGRLQGMWRILRMPPSRRSELIGRAHRPPAQTAFSQREVA